MLTNLTLLLSLPASLCLVIIYPLLFHLSHFHSSALSLSQKVRYGDEIQLRLERIEGSDVSNHREYLGVASAGRMNQSEDCLVFVEHDHRCAVLVAWCDPSVRPGPCHCASQPILLGLLQEFQVQFHHKEATRT